MLTPHVFIDTQVFRKFNFNYNSDTFQQIVEFTKRGRIFLYSTTITIQEVEAHIVREVQAAKAALKKARKDCQILSNLADAKFDKLFHSFDDGEVIQRLCEQFDNFIQETETEVLTITDVPVEDIFKKYFQSQPPFSEGKKKYEFPDAFVLAAVEKWCGDNCEKIYVISGDEDMKIACEQSNNLIYLKNIDNLVELAVEFENEEIAGLGYESLEENSDALQQLIADEFYLMRFCLNEYDGDVTDVMVNSVKIVDQSLVDIGKDFILFKLDVEVDFNADVSYDDLDSSPWNSDDKEYLWINKIEENINQTVTIPVKAEFSFSENELSEAEIEVKKVELDTNQVIEINIDEENYEIY